MNINRVNRPYGKIHKQEDYLGKYKFISIY